MLDPLQFAFASYLLPETLFATAYAAAAYAAVRVLQAHRPALPWAAAFGAALAVATFVRPTTYYLPIAAG